MTETGVTRSTGLAITESAGVGRADAVGITEERIRVVVDEFYRRARRDDQLGPIFAAHIDDWDHHLARMADFWSAALRRTGRYSGHPVERHWSIAGLTARHFERWISLFDATLRDLCPPSEAEVFLGRALRIRAAMTRNLGLAGGTAWSREHAE